MSLRQPIADRRQPQQRRVGQGPCVRAQHGQGDAAGDGPGDQAREHDAGVLNVHGQLLPAGVNAAQQLLPHHAGHRLVAQHRRADHRHGNHGREPADPLRQSLRPAAEGPQAAGTLQYAGVQPGQQHNHIAGRHAGHAAAGQHRRQLSVLGVVSAPGAPHQIPQGKALHGHGQNRRRRDAGPHGQLNGHFAQGQHKHHHCRQQGEPAHGEVLRQRGQHRLVQPRDGVAEAEERIQGQGQQGGQQARAQHLPDVAV